MEKEFPQAEEEDVSEERIGLPSDVRGFVFGLACALSIVLALGFGTPHYCYSAILDEFGPVPSKQTCVPCPIGAVCEDGRFMGHRNNTRLYRNRFVPSVAQASIEEAFHASIQRQLSVHLCEQLAEGVAARTAESGLPLPYLKTLVRGDALLTHVYGGNNNTFAAIWQKALSSAVTQPETFNLRIKRDTFSLRRLPVGLPGRCLLGYAKERILGIEMYHVLQGLGVVGAIALVFLGMRMAYTTVNERREAIVLASTVALTLRNFQDRPELWFAERDLRDELSVEFRHMPISKLWNDVIELLQQEDTLSQRMTDLGREWQGRPSMAGAAGIGAHE